MIQGTGGTNFIGVTMERISRRELSRIAALKRKKNRREQGKLIIEGWRLIGDALSAGALETLLLVPDDPRSEIAAGILVSAQEKGIPVRSLHKEEVKRITSTVTSPGVFGMARFRLLEIDDLFGREQDSSAGPLVYLYEIRDPGNIGTILRTSHALGAGGVIVSPGSCDPTNAKAARSSMGALFRVPIAAGDAGAVFEAARNRGYTIAVMVASDPDESERASLPESLHNAQPVLLVFGNEAEGLPDDLQAVADRKISIPIEAGAQSLNVAASCAVILYSLRKDR